jgi:hypothetical protein
MELPQHVTEFVRRFSMTPGVYIITLNGKSYIGESARIGKRVKIHISNLIRNKSEIPLMQQDFDAVGITDFSAIVASVEFDPAIRLLKEKSLIQQFDQNQIYNRRNLV